MEYEYLYKRRFDIKDSLIWNKSSLIKYDIFISAYNSSYRVNYLIDNIEANEKHIFILPEYNFGSEELENLEDKFNLFKFSTFDESEIFLEYFRNHIIPNIDKNIIFDITGFLRHHIVYFIRLCKQIGIKKVDFLYSEPIAYKNKENTKFSRDFQYVRDIKGCGGSHSVDVSNDYLIIGSGYDYNMVLNIAKEKKKTKKVQILGFPSLQADMFQQNVLKAYQAEEEIYPKIELDSKDVILAPANDPFVTASLLSKFVNKVEQLSPITNLYLCPLSTKSQTLGIALYYISECLHKSVSIIFPFCKGYEKETSEGISRFWLYTIEF
jgi:hypothetical protein